MNLFSAGLVSNSWKKEGLHSLTKKLRLSPSSTCSLLNSKLQHSFFIPTGKSLWHNEVSFARTTKKRNDAHAHTHIHTFWQRHVEVETVCTSKMPDTVYQNQKGQLNQRRLPGVLSLFKDKGTRNTWPAPPVFSYIKNTRFWEWMWCCHDFLVYRVRLLEPGDAFLPACCRMACVCFFFSFFAKQNLEWRIYDCSTQATPLLIISFNASNHQDVLKKNSFYLKPVWSTL